MPRVRRIELEEFKYPAGGQIAVGNAVLVQEVGFDQISVHRQMSHAVLQALVGMEKHRSLVEKQAEDAPPTINEDGTEDDGAEGLMNLFGMAIEDADKFEKIVARIQKTLTNNATLARIEGTDAPITDQAWRGIAETNGVDGVNRILSVFASFFLGGQQAPTSENGNGRAELLTSSSPSAVASVSRRPDDFLSENLGNLRRI